MVVTRRQASAVKAEIASTTTHKVNYQLKSTTRGRPLTRASERLSSSDSSSPSSVKSSRSSSPDSSSNSSTKELSPPNSHSSKSRMISTMIENMDKMKINNTNNSSPSVDTSSSQQVNRLPESGLISVYKSNRNGDCLCLHGYTYQINRHMENKIKWKCKQSRDKTKCGAKIYTTKNLGTDQIPAYQYLQSNSIQHSHDADHDQQKVSTFISQLKDIGKNYRSVPPSKIVNELATSMKLTDEQLGMIPCYSTLYQKVHRARTKTIPPLPKSMKFEVLLAFSITSLDECFIFLDHLYVEEPKRILAFASPMQLENLFSSKLICIDGTFSICPRQYKQLLIIQTIDLEKYDATPVVYALLNDKKSHTYGLLFQALKRKAKEMKMKFEPDRIITDVPEIMGLPVFCRHLY